jgi:tetratricopeptide (TPR) repeat protein
MRRCWLGLLMLMCSTAALAQSPPPPNPTLIARVRGVDDEVHKIPLRLADLNVDVSIVGAIARATVRAHFLNSTGEQVEGEFALVLPDGATVTGYALDIEGQMIDGVLAEPSRARAAYEARVRRKVDPGIAEVSPRNVFSTRVYPISEQNGRTILVAFVAPIHALSGWALPISLTRSVRKTEFRVQAQGVKSAPNLVLPSPLKAEWRTEDGTFVAQVSGKNQKLSGEIRLGPPTPTSPMVTTYHSNGQRFFQLSDEFPATNGARAAPKRLRIYWDRSRSHMDDAPEAEAALVSRFLERAKPTAIDVVLFNSSGVTVETRNTAAAVSELLKGVVYRGGTSFAVLQSARIAPASMCLMVSDGIATVDRRDGFKPDCDLIALSGAPDADVGYLARLMSRSPSDVLRLNGRTPDELLARLYSESPGIVDVRDAQGAALPFTPLPGPRGRIAAVGMAPPSGEIVVRVSDGAKITERRYTVDSASAAFDGAGALWAADQVIRLAAADSKKQVLEVSRRYEVASPHLSFVVFESPRDYANADLTLPKRYPTKWRNEYFDAKAERQEALKEERASRLEEVTKRWEDQKKWWATQFDPSAPPRSKPSTGAYGRDGGVNADLQEIVTTGTRGVAQGAQIELEPWNVNRPYIKVLNAAPTDRFADVLAAQEKKYGDLPAFYLDVAEWLYRHRRVPEAIEMALTALELPARNDETLAIVADRMSRYGDLDRAISLYERLLDVAPDRPQPRRSLALALAGRATNSAPAAAVADLQRAMSLLNEVILTPWDRAYDGIEVISITEANWIASRLRKLRINDTGLNPKLLARMDVDLRVVIEWNTAATDIDLWVEEPNGEMVMYSEPLSAIGGHLSNDMVQGFGPEEYLLRRAPNGTFKVRANVYAVDALNPNGATTVTARLIYDYGRPTERTERRDIELAPSQGNKDPVLVGKVVFKRSQPAKVAQD